MNLMFINIKGRSNIVKRKRIACLIQASKIDVCFIQETKLASLDELIVSLLWGDSNVKWTESGVVGSAGGVVILWEEGFTQGFVGVNIEWRGQEIFLVIVYSSCHLLLKKRLWRELVGLKNKFSRGGWIVGGLQCCF